MSKARDPDRAPKTPSKAEVFAERRAEFERKLGLALGQARREMLAEEGNHEAAYEATELATAAAS